MRKKESLKEGPKERDGEMVVGSHGWEGFRKVAEKLAWRQALNRVAVGTSLFLHRMGLSDSAGLQVTGVLCVQSSQDVRPLEGS